jgi:hypothetical protein
LQEWLSIYTQVPIKTILQLLRIARKYKLNPLFGEITFEEIELGSWQAFISVDGWYQILNAQPTYQGIEFTNSIEVKEDVPIWMECTIYRSDRQYPITVREYFSELKTEHLVWQKLPRRMMRHRTLQQCIRMAFGIHAPEITKSAPVLSAPTKLESSLSRPRFLKNPQPENRIELVKAALKENKMVDAR